MSIHAFFALEIQNNPSYVLEVAYAQARSGNAADARKNLAALEEFVKQDIVAPLSLARIHLALGEKEQALERLRLSVTRHDTECLYFKVDPRLAPLRTEPRFIALLKEIGFPE